MDARDRWRLILGEERAKMSSGTRRFADALDEMYGRGGEGSVDLRHRGAGREPGFPSVRAWTDEIEALFGKAVCEQIIGRAATLGKTSALLEADPDRMSPSIELLKQILSLKGGLPEAKMASLRRLCQRIVDDIVANLRKTVSPSLRGLTINRPSARPSGRLHLPRTIRANLAHAQIIDGQPRVVPERLYFRASANASLQWQVVLVVDVSGSMETSVVYSAMMAAILAGLPWLTVNFLTFNTEVIDLSNLAPDPLGLLLEVDVGGGTDIGRALSYASTLLRVPSRSCVILVSDFEEGGSVSRLLANVKQISDAGATCLGLAALDDAGAAVFNRNVAELVAGAGMEVASLSPLQLAQWLGSRLP